jgi:hypothetical protein
MLTNGTRRSVGNTCDRSFGESGSIGHGTCQEIGLATQATFIIGHHRIDWKILWRAFKILETSIGMQKLYNASLHTDTVTFLYGSFSSLSFRDLVLHTRNRRSYDPRDKIFALLSHPAATDPETGTPLIRVDYNTSIEQVYAEATIVMLRSKGDLHDFSFAYRNDTLSWPSWVPRWDEYPQLGWLLSCKDARPFSACGKYRLQRNLDFRIIIHDRRKLVLDVDGFHIDTIAASIQVPSIFRNSSEWFKFLNNISQHSLQPFGHYGDNYDQALKPCLTMSRANMDDGIPDMEIPNDTYISKGIFLPMKRSNALRAAEVQLEVSKTGCPLRWNPDSRSMTIFMTRPGFIGTTPTCNLHNTVAIMRGGSVPYILEPRGNQVSLVNECYIPLMMHGEVDGMVERGELDIKTFGIV